jgi:hypothetical protein
MSQGLIIFIAIGAILGYILVGFIGDLEEEDDKLLTQEKLIRKQDRVYYQKDVVGQTILVLKDVPMAKKIGIWKRSPLHQEFMDLVPNFEDLRNFVNDRIIDKDFQDKLLKAINTAEDDYFSGKITQGEIKEKLGAL